jgi:hypothetical protein
VIQTQSVVHSAVLGWQVRPGTLQGAFLGQVGALLQVYRDLSASAGHVVAVEVILGQVREQAAVLAFGDAYRITFFAALVATLLAVLLPGRGAVKADQSAMIGG